MSRKRSTILGGVFVGLLVIGLSFWFAGAVTNEDPLWFLRSFNAKADWIVLYWDGRTSHFFEGDPQYDVLLSAFSQAIARESGYEGHIALSDEDLQRQRDEGRFLEFHYSQPVQVHTRYPFPPARCFFIPLSGEHAARQRVFSGPSDRPRDGALRLRDDHFADLIDIAQKTVFGDLSP